MKKKILFLCSNMNIGGFQRSILSLLQCFDYEKYEVELLLSEPDGILSRYIPKQVRILEPIISPVYYTAFPGCITSLVRQGHFVQAFFRIMGAAISVINKGNGFVFSNKIIPKLSTYYDAIVDYNGQQLLYYMVDSINAGKKISFFHSDYQKWPYYKKTDERYYSKVDAIVTVSDECVASMKKIFPQYSDKIYKIENIVSPKTVQTSEDTKYFLDEYDGVRILTVGRVCFDKGLDLAIGACKILKDAGYKFKWYWIGPYDKRDEWVVKISQENLADMLVLIGPTDNPYGYMRQADLLVHPSRFEGKSVTVEEAKVLHIPVVVTNYSTVHNQIENEKNGLIVEMDVEAIAEAISDLIVHPEKRLALRNQMALYCKGNEEEVVKLYTLIEK